MVMWYCTVVWRSMVLTHISSGSAAFAAAAALCDAVRRVERCGSGPRVFVRGVTWASFVRLSVRRFPD